ncbi:hypothetical protein lerEdw1_002730 [Lerista edwardsae]|nr:hypothetical protein lerEdw1_002730 [Lerista edwardsae]
MSRLQLAVCARADVRQFRGSPASHVPVLLCSAHGGYLTSMALLRGGFVARPSEALRGYGACAGPLGFRAGSRGRFHDCPPGAPRNGWAVHGRREPGAALALGILLCRCGKRSSRAALAAKQAEKELPAPKGSQSLGKLPLAPACRERGCKDLMMSWKGPAHVHRSIDSGKVKDPTRPAFPQEQSPNIYQGSNQPSTSKAVKKVPPHLVQVDGSSEKLGKKKKLAIPKIIVTGPSDEVLMSNLSDELPETRTIRDTEEYGPFTVHSKPSTVDAYRNHRE